MTSFRQELMGSHGFSLIPLNRLSAVISANSRLLLPSKSVLAYARKQSQSAIFEWVEEDRGWYWHADDYPLSWEKKVKVTNISASGKKGSAKLKSTKKGGDTSEACFDVVPFESDLPPICNIVLKGSPPPFPIPVLACVPLLVSPSLLLHNYLQMLLLLVGHEAVKERHPLILSPPLSGKYVISNSTLSFIYIYIYIYINFPAANPDMLADFSL